jgi:hypothetical protein
MLPILMGEVLNHSFLIGFKKEKYDLGGLLELLLSFRYGKSMHFYKSILGLDTILYDFTSTENNENFRKVFV